MARQVIGDGVGEWCVIVFRSVESAPERFGVHGGSLPGPYGSDFRPGPKAEPHAEERLTAQDPSGRICWPD